MFAGSSKAGVGVKDGSVRMVSVALLPSHRHTLRHDTRQHGDHHGHGGQDQHLNLSVLGGQRIVRDKQEIYLLTVL